MEVARLSWEDLLSPVMPKIRDHQNPLEIYCCKAKKTNWNWCNAARVTLRFLFPKKTTFSLSAFPFPDYFRHSFQPSASDSFLHVERRMPLLLGIHHLLQPRHHFFIRTMSPGRAPDVMSRGCVLVLLCELLSCWTKENDTSTWCLSTIHLSTNMSICISIQPFIRQAMYIYPFNH